MINHKSITFDKEAQDNLPKSVKDKMEADRRKSDAIHKILELNKNGYAGVNKNGNIVDRREFPDAIPVQENSIFGVVKPKKL